MISMKKIIQILLLLSINLTLSASELVLKPDNAELNGDVGLSQGLIQFWHGLDSSVSWNVIFNDPGEVNVSIFVACPSDFSGSVVEVSLAGQSIRCEITSTDSWADYQEKTIGKFTISAAGKYKISVNPVSKPKRAVANLSKAILSGDAVRSASVGKVRRRDIVSTFGWDGDKDAAIAYPGSFLIRDGRQFEVGFDVFEKHTTYKWYNHSGYLPCLVTDFDYDNCNIKIMNFGDKVCIDGNDFVIAYSRVSITNNSVETKNINPGASGRFIKLNSAGNTILAGNTVNHDYAIVLDRFGNSFSLPGDDDICAAGSWDEHFLHMKAYWNQKLSEIAIVETPDQELNDAYKAGYIYTYIVKDGLNTHVGENGYDQMWDHDAVGILATLLTMGDFREAKQLLDVLPISLQYDDGTWKYSWPFALYLLKTGDKGPALKHWKDIKMSAHKISADRTGPGGIMKVTNDIDTHGLWTIDNWSGMFGLACYNWLCKELGETEEALWASKEYAEFHDVVNKTLENTLEEYNINYIPASIVGPNSKNRCNTPNDANWAAHFFFGRWAWDGWLAGAKQAGANLDLIDATYDYGFGRLKEAGYPPHTYGGYAGYCTAYNAGYAGAALRGERYRTEGVRNYQFMISNAQSGPYSWWEGILNPSDTEWEGIHPSGGTGSCPHMWGQSCISKVLLESIAAEFYDGTLLVGRGVPSEWLSKGEIIKVNNFPVNGNNRVDIMIKSLSPNTILMSVDGEMNNSNNIIFNLPLMKDNIKSVSVGTFDQNDGKVILSPGNDNVIVTLKKNLY